MTTSGIPDASRRMRSGEMYPTEIIIRYDWSCCPYWRTPDRPVIEYKEGQRFTANFYVSPEDAEGGAQGGFAFVWTTTGHPVPMFLLKVAPGV